MEGEVEKTWLGWFFIFFDKRFAMADCPLYGSQWFMGMLIHDNAIVKGTGFKSGIRFLENVND